MPALLTVRGMQRHLYFNRLQHAFPLPRTCHLWTASNVCPPDPQACNVHACPGSTTGLLRAQAYLYRPLYTAAKPPCPSRPRAL